MYMSNDKSCFLVKCKTRTEQLAWDFGFFLYGFDNMIASDYNETGTFCFSSQLNVLINIGV